MNYFGNCCWNFGCCYVSDSKWKGKVAIVTGGNQGIGFYIVKGLAKMGMKVVIGNIYRSLNFSVPFGRKSKSSVGFVERTLGRSDDFRSIFARQSEEIC
jgi:NAD(P)-dependent dehydrogenase (short-subunit alcohol dehydrogenase family)